MTSEQRDDAAAYVTAADNVLHSFGADHPTMANKVKEFAEMFEAWVASNPVPE